MEYQLVGLFIAAALPPFLAGLLAFLALEGFPGAEGTKEHPVQDSYQPMAYLTGRSDSVVIRPAA